jgi:hypothetical protein
MFQTKLSEIGLDRREQLNVGGCAGLVDRFTERRFI